MPRLRCAVSDATLVLMVAAMTISNKELTEYGVAAKEAPGNSTWPYSSQRLQGLLVNGGVYLPLQMFSDSARKT